MRAVAIASLAALIGGLPASTVHAAGAEALVGPWIEPGLSFPEGTRSARVVRSDEPVLRQASAGAPRIGSAHRDVRLPVFSAVRGPGCRAAWLRVGPRAWMCADTLELSGEPPIPAGLKTLVDSPDGLPYAYYFVGPGGSFGYREARLVDVGTPDFQLEPGFAVAIVEARTIDGERYGRTGNDLWVPMRDLGPVHASTFQGVEIAEGAAPGSAAPFAWIVARSAPTYAGPSRARPTGESIAHLVQVDVLEEKAGAYPGAPTFLRVGDDRWIEADDVRRPTFEPPPTEVQVAAGERWIDVELASQTLVAWEGERPVFATLVSTGKGRQGSASATPKGVHRIWVKLLSSNMDNLEDENANRWYRMENVPWVQYFSKGVGLHGAFWHRSFGHVRSHGCVNLAPLDAQRLFHFTGPRLPAGWTAVLPEASAPGTLVRVR
jgi:lipoprotein-anchoring transpeptidase ErfK/SrfK